MIYLTDCPHASLFSKTNNKKKSETEPNKDLKLSLTKTLNFDNNKMQSAPAQKHLGLILDSKLDSNQHIDDQINKM